MAILQGTRLIGLALIRIGCGALARKQAVPPDGTSRTILVVEDEWLLRDELAHAFRADGWVVLEAATGEAAVAILQHNRIDTLLTDIQLGGSLSGWDVAEAGRAANPATAIVYISGNTECSRRVSASHFFKKPYSLAAVVAACRGGFAMLHTGGRE
jgi:DNA-binding response OmpR family regulator